MTRMRLIASAAMATVLGYAGGASALPQSPVIAGTNGPGPGATFSTTTTTLSVTQTNSRVVINWAGFNIASGETVTFAQPTNTSIALNVVGAGSFTTISGALNANGGVWIFSPAGLLIGNGAAINVGSLLASTAIADSTSTTDFLCDCGGTIPFQPQPASATPSITVQSGATIDANAGFVELNSPSIVQGGNITASDSVDYSALPGLQVDFDQGSNGFKLTDIFGTTAPAQNQATSITHTGNTTAGGIVTFATFNDPSLGAPVSSVINLSGHVTANGIISDNTTGTAYGVLLTADQTANGINNGAFQVPASSSTEINASGSVITTAAGRIGAEAGSVTTGDWTSFDLGGGGLNIEAGSGGLTVPGTLSFSGAGEATLSSLGPATISGAINSGEADGLSLTASSINLSGSISMSHGFLSLSTPGALTISGAISAGHEGASLVESGSSPVVLSGPFGANGDLGQNVSLTFTGAPDSGQSLTIGGSPYTLIFDQAELLAVNGNLAGDYALAAPIDLTGTIFGGAPIASTVGATFTGTFTGLGNTISNLTIADKNPVAQAIAPSTTGFGEVGLFGVVDFGGVVEDVSIRNANVSGTDGMQVGALIGLLGGAGTVRNASSSGQVATGSAGPLAAFNTADAGGLVGYSGGLISGSSSSASVTGGNALVGGLVGLLGPGGGASVGSIIGSSASGSVSVGSVSTSHISVAGGLVGAADGTSTQPASITASFATGNVTGAGGTYVGGFAGLVEDANISDAYATGAVAQTGPGVPSLTNIIGGFAGDVVAGGVITQSYASGPVTSVGGPDTQHFTFAGGFVGLVAQSGASVSDAYALGAVTVTGSANNDVGGFAGAVFDNGSVDGVYATGALSATGTVGGVSAIVGDASGDPGGTLTNAYWDEGTTGVVTGFTLLGAGSASNVTGIGGSTGLSPYDPATYANFDLANTWFMLTGQTRPMLRSEYSTTITNAHQLQLMAMDLAANYVLAGDIDASEATSASGVWNPANGFVPVGDSEANAFTGSLDGAGHSVSNLTIVDTTPVNQTAFGGYAINGFAGLFGFVGPAGLVENLGIDNAAVTAGDGFDAGILAGALEGRVFNVSTSGSVLAGNDVNTGLGLATVSAGGLIGAFDGLAINTSSSANVTGGDAVVGGLIGAGANANIPGGGIIFASHASGDVTVGASSSTLEIAAGGGLAGTLFGFQFGNVNPSPISAANSYATGSVTGGAGSSIGGFAGSIDESSVTGSYATGSVTQTAGGQNGESSLAGGFAGAIVSNSIVDKSWSGGPVITVSGPTNSLFTVAGGFVGNLAKSQAEKDYSLSSVVASGGAFSALGGFAGAIQNTAAADQVYATGLVSGPGLLGGLVGVGLGPSTLSNSYWDEGTTGQTIAVGSSSGTVAGVAGVGGSTGRSPYLASSYPAFNFGNQPGDSDNWAIAPGETRPMLVAEYSTIITNVHQLELMSLDLTNNYTLAANIDARETSNPAGVFNPANGFVPVGGNGEGAFTGSLDGQGHTVSNLTSIDTSTTPQTGSGVAETNGVVGLFGYVDGSSGGGLVENVNLVNASMTGGNGMRVGALVGVDINGALIDDSSSGTVVTGSAVTIHPPGGGTATAIAGAGGLVGFSDGSIIDSHSSATVAANSGYAGGLVGTFSGTDISDSFATGDVSVGSFSGLVQFGTGPLAGGLVGLLSEGPSNTPFTVSDSYATGNVAGGAGSNVGGFAGTIQLSGQVIDSYATGDVAQSGGSVNGQQDFIGGFAGAIAGSTVSQSFASGTVTTVGGASGLLTNAGGFAGTLDTGAINDAYSTGSVTTSGSAFSMVGGFVGLIQEGGVVDRVYATGLVSGPGQLAGLAGQIGNPSQTDASGSLIDSYWDEGTTGQASGFSLAGTGSATSVTGIGGSTGINPFLQATYANWDFNNVWASPSPGLYPGLFGASHVLRVTGGTTTFSYGAYTAVTYTLLGLQGGDAAPVVQGLATSINGTSNASSGYYNAGGFGVTFGSATATGASGAYRLLYAPGTLTITPRALTGSLIGTVEKTYDGTTSAGLASGNYQLSGSVVPGDVVALNDPANGTYASKDAGNAIGVSVNGLALTGADAADYTVNASAGAAIGVIDPKAITATLTGTAEKTYDGTTAAVLGAANYQLSGVVAGDSVSLNDPANGTYASKNAGSGITVNVSGLGLTGANAGDYTVNGSTSAAIGLIDPKALVATLTGTVEKTYDGTTAASLTGANYQLTGVVAGDTVSLNDPANGAYDSKNAGVGKTVSVSGLAISGADSANYTVNNIAAAGVGVIDPKLLTVSVVGTVEKTYDGTTAATLAAGNYQVSGAIAGDAVSLNDPANGTYDSKTVGNGKTVNVVGLALTGADAADYSVNGAASGAVGIIDPKALTASLIGSVSKPFDTTTTATLTPANYLLSGAVAGDNVTLNDPAVGAYDTAAPGTGKTVTVLGLTLLGPDAVDYTVNGTAFAAIGAITQSAPPIQVQIITAPSDTALTELSGVNPPPSDETATGPPTDQTSQAAAEGQAPGAGPSPSNDQASNEDSATSGEAPSGGSSSPAGAASGSETPGGPGSSGGEAQNGSASGSSGESANGAPAGAPAAGGAEASSGAGASAGAPAGAGQVVGASEAAAVDQTQPASGQSAQAGVFPVAKNAPSGRPAGNNAPVTGAGNGDLWTGSDLGGAQP